MKVGLFSVSDHYPAELGRTSQQLYQEQLNQIVHADQLGFDSFWLAEHHFHEYGIMPRPAILLAAAAAQTSRIRLGAGVVVLPFDNPLRVAEDYAMVDILSEGRLMLGVGSGYLAHEYSGFGIDPQEKRNRFDEALNILQKAWTGERFDFEGRYHSVKNVQLNIRPLQQPMPPLFVAILRNGAAQFLGARRQQIMMIPYATTENVDDLQTTVSAYQQSFVQAGGKKSDATVPFGLHVVCAPTRAEAHKLSRPAFDRYVRTRLYARQRKFDDLVEKDLVAFGDPNDILRIVGRYKAAGLTHLLAMMNFGGLDHKHVLQSMELLATEVIPNLQ